VPCRLKKVAIGIERIELCIDASAITRVRKTHPGIPG
jgi:hypothetical protein